MASALVAGASAAAVATSKSLLEKASGKPIMKTLTHNNEDDFFDDIEIGEIFLIAGMLFSEAKDIADNHDYNIEDLGSNKAKVTEKKEEYKPHRSSTYSSFSAIDSISHSSSGGFGGFSHSGGFGGFGGGSFGGGGGKF